VTRDTNAYSQLQFTTTQQFLQYTLHIAPVSTSKFILRIDEKTRTNFVLEIDVGDKLAVAW